MSKKIIPLVVILIAIAGMYFGALLPFQKSQLYSATNRASATFTNLEDFKTNYDKLFLFNSPVGQEEVVKFFITSVLSSLSQGGFSAETARGLVEYTEQYIEKENVLHLLHMGYLYELLWEQLGESEYFARAVGYYTQVRDIGPTLPHPLYRLFDLYRKHGDIEKAREIGSIILSLWPQDNRVESALNMF